MFTCRVTFDTFDILSDNEVRQGLKKFSNWPTFPQLYVKGELIGGLDIVKVSTVCKYIAFYDFLHSQELKESEELLSTLGLSE